MYGEKPDRGRASSTISQYSFKDGRRGQKTNFTILHNLSNYFKIVKIHDFILESRFEMQSNKYNMLCIDLVIAKINRLTFKKKIVINQEHHI